VPLKAAAAMPQDASIEAGVAPRNEACQSRVQARLSSFSFISNSFLYLLATFAPAAAPPQPPRHAHAAAAAPPARLCAPQSLAGGGGLAIMNAFFR